MFTRSFRTCGCCVSDVQKLLADIRQEIFNVQMQHPHVHKELADVLMLCSDVQKLLEDIRQELFNVQKQLPYV
jgi:ribosomal protein L29